MRFDNRNILAVLAAGLIGTSEGLRLWSMNEDHNTENLRNRRLEGFGGKSFLEMKHNFQSMKAQLEASPVVELELPNELLECDLKKGNPAVSTGLAEKFPELSFYSGSCGDNKEVNIIFNTDEGAVDSFSASVSSPVDNFYIDSAEFGSDKYVMYKTTDARKHLIETEQYTFHDDVIVDQEFLDSFESSSRRLGETRSQQEKLQAAYAELAKVAQAQRDLQGSHTGYKFRLAILTNAQYSSYHGNTKASVLSALVTLMSRVNGIYMREFGTYMELIPNQDVAICLSGDPRSACSTIPNTSNAIDAPGTVFPQIGISSSDYDIGHTVTTGSGGLAGYPSLCRSDKYRGTTGLSSPENDVFAVDFVAHEIGHQFFGAHSFRDCGGPSDNNLMTAGAAEPGGGTSIMGYAGICSAQDIQANSDPYFNSANLVPMYDYVLSVVGSCGESFPISPAINPISSGLSIASTCSVPLGNPFQLNANGLSGNNFYSWDRVDLGYEDLDSQTLGRFRSWKPTRMSSRFFPNLNFLTHGINRDEEELPSVARSMTFRFTERTLYDTFQTEDSFDLGILGQFQTRDVDVDFVSSLTPISVGFSGASPGQTVSVSFTADSSAGTIEFLVAENGLQSSSDLQYDSQVQELNWISVGSAAATSGSATITIPTGLSGRVSLIARAGSDTCFYFAFVADISQGSEGGGNGGTGGGEPTAPAPTPFPVAGGCVDSVPSGLTLNGVPTPCDQLAIYCAGYQIVRDRCPLTCGECFAARNNAEKIGFVDDRKVYDIPVV